MGLHDKYTDNQCEILASLLRGERPTIATIGTTPQGWSRAINCLVRDRMVEQDPDGTLRLAGTGYDAARVAAIMLRRVCDERGSLTASHWDVARAMGVIPTAARIALGRARAFGWVALTSKQGWRTGVWSTVPGTAIPKEQAA